MAAERRRTLQQMYNEWPFFQSTIDLVEMVLNKADMRIQQSYDRHLLKDPQVRAPYHWGGWVGLILEWGCGGVGCALAGSGGRVRVHLSVYFW